MALMPKRVKYRKSQRGRIRGKAQRGNFVAFGSYGLQSLEHGRITGKQIEAARVTIRRAIGNQARYWIRIFPHKGYSKKPAETRQGKGKGDVEYWAAVIRPGTILFEVDGVPVEVAREAFRKQSAKLPVRCKMVHRRSHL
ncbi:MAG TPA: 50S ribosomal protein L16 [Planctomycetes bacterium]|nr:50S ribosomal protein L16 [Planctomycetota bacterium]